MLIVFLFIFSTVKVQTIESKAEKEPVVAVAPIPAAVEKKLPINNDQKSAQALPPPPPGFGIDAADVSLNQPILKATPISAPPPGFEKKQPATPSEPKQEYIKPEDYGKRNEELGTNLSILFGHFNQNEFELFKKTSVEFRRDHLNAKEYLNECQRLLELPLNSPEAYLLKSNLENRAIFIKFLELIQEMIVSLFLY